MRLKTGLVFISFIAIIFFFAMVLVPTHSTNGQQTDGNQTNVLAARAYQSISNAERLGANVTTEVQNFNDGLGLMQVGNYSDASHIFNSVIVAANSSAVLAQSKGSPSNFYLTVPLVATILSLLSCLGVAIWYEIDRRQVLDMKIQEAKDEGTKS